MGVVLIVRSRGSGDIDDESNLREIPLAERPFTSLIPKDDGHWLKMLISEVKVADAKQLDYELLYKLPDGRTQGVPGTVTLNGEKIERDLLLGSESSGKFRYDEGVENGTLTLRFRNDKGKLIGKLSTDFHLQQDTTDLTSVNGQFKYKLDTKPKKVFFVTMGTLGLPKYISNDISSVTSGPYGIFASTEGKFSGEVGMILGSLNLVKQWDGTSWVDIDSTNKSSNIGVFVGL